MTARTACAFCGVPAEPGADPSARMDLVPEACGACAGLRPAEPGAALRAAARAAGADERDPHLMEALAEDDACLDGVMYADPADPLRSRRAPQAEPWAHVPAATRDALRRARARGLDRRVREGAEAPAAEGPPPAGPGGCLVCGAASSASWRAVTTGALAPGGLVEGHLCAACSAVRDEVGAVGPSLVERAAAAHAGLRWGDEMRAPGLQAWVATGLPPGEPWAWVELRMPEPEPTLAELAAEVAALRVAVARLEAAR